MQSHHSLCPQRDHLVGTQDYQFIRTCTDSHEYTLYSMWANGSIRIYVRTYRCTVRTEYKQMHSGAI